MENEDVQQPQVVHVRRCGGCSALVPLDLNQCPQCGATFGKVTGRRLGRGVLVAFLAGFFIVGVAAAYVIYRKHVSEAGADLCRQFDVSDSCHEVLGDARFHAMLVGLAAGAVGGAVAALFKFLLNWTDR